MQELENKRGFTLIEVLIATFVIATTMVGLFGLFVLSIRLAGDAERRVVAIALANERAEMIRNLPYVEVGTQGGIPSGTILQEESVTRNNDSYTVRIDIRYIDDPYDGEGGAGEGGGCVTICHVPPGNPGNENTLCEPQSALDAHFVHGDYAGPCGGGGEGQDDPLNTDYKQVRIAVSWSNVNNLKPVLLVMWIAPQGVEGGELFGTLDFQAMNAQGQGVEGAQVTLFNDTVSPAVDITTNTNAEGRVIIPGLPESSGSYELTVGKSGYTTEMTFDASGTFTPDVDHTHLSALVGQLTEKTFFIDLVSSLDILTAYPRNRASRSVDAAESADYLFIEHVPAYEISNGSLSFWFKADDVGLPGQGLFSKDADSFGSGGHLSIGLNGSDLVANHQSATGDNTVQVSGIQEDTWHHAVYTFGNAGMKLYVDGAVPQTNSYNGGWGSNLEPLVMGANAGGSASGTGLPVTDAFGGRLDEVRIYNRELTESEVEELANGSDVSGGLIGYWHLNEMTGSEAEDAAAGNNGSWQGEATYVLDTPFSGGAGEVIGAVSYLLQGSKTIGQDNLNNPVYLVDVTAATSAGGENTHQNLAWDEYRVVIDGAAGGYDIRDANSVLPLTLDPNESLALELLLADHTARSLRLVVTGADGQPIPGARAVINGFGISEVRETSGGGQAFYDSLPLNGDYDLMVTAPGFQDLNSTVDVTNTTVSEIQLSTL